VLAKDGFGEYQTQRALKRCLKYLQDKRAHIRMGEISFIAFLLPLNYASLLVHYMWQGVKSVENNNFDLSFFGTKTVKVGTNYPELYVCFLEELWKA
jgi:hypothetical protein